MLRFHLLFMLGALLLALLIHTPVAPITIMNPKPGLVSVVVEAVQPEFAPSRGYTSQSGSHGSCCPGAGAAR